MKNNRRGFLKKTVLASGANLLVAKSAQADWLEKLFVNSPVDKRLTHSFNIQEIKLSDNINLKIPTIAENGAVVPLTVTSSLENVEQVSIFVEKNPVPLIAIFDLTPDVEAFVSARVKMAETSNVIVIVKAQSQWYKTQKQVKVTIGGCGG